MHMFIIKSIQFQLCFNYHFDLVMCYIATCNCPKFFVKVSIKLPAGVDYFLIMDNYR